MLQFANLRMLYMGLYYHFFDNFRDVNKFEEFEMYTDYLNLASAEENLDKCVLPSK